ncbi:MAG: DUF2752 domain-containing protein [Bacteroidia bacterium]|nr:DUF2752 domain-containing protein [Bacteroidia bacterium]
MKPFRKRLTFIWLCMLLVFPLVLWALPSDFFDEGQSICPSYVFLGIECLGCGITRAVMHLHHFEFDDAIYYNNGVFVIYPLLIVVWGYWLYLAAIQLYPQMKLGKSK